MKTIMTTAVAWLVAIFISQPVCAQTKLTMPQKKGQPGKAALTNPPKAAAADAKSQLGEGAVSAWPLQGAADKAMLDRFVSEKGQQPRLAPPVQRSPYGPEDDTEYTYIGFNAAAGLAADGTTLTGGMVNFSLQPFACDTVSSDDGVSPYSYIMKGRLYSFLPHLDMATGRYTSLTLTVYDANTMTRISQRTVDAPGEESRMPYIISYDDQRDVVYAISLDNNEPAIGDDESYYLNILDTATLALKRVGYLGGWRGYREKGNFAPKGFTAASGVLRVLNSDDSLYICEINPATCEIKTVGRTTMPTQYVYGLQPIYYDSQQGSLLVNHYDFNNGTQYYKVSPFIAYGSTDNICKTELLENAPTGFTWFDKRPAAKPVFSSCTLAGITDYNVSLPDGGTTATVTFTVPDTDTEGNKIEVPSYGSKNIRCNVYVDNVYTDVTGLPATITYGDKITFTVELTHGLHVVTVQLYPLFNEVAQSRAGQTVVCGYDAPASVGEPALTLDGQRALITWTAPTSGRYADFGSLFDASDITYTVVRNTDGKTIAEGITETSAEDVIESEEIQVYSYTVYAESHGMTGEGATTNSISAGQYIPLPYDNDFADASCLDSWTVINADNNGSARTWTWNYYYYYLTSGFGSADDWLITPAFRLSADKLYALKYDVSGSGTLTTTVGNGITAEAQTTVLDEIDEAADWVTKELYYHPNTEDNYSFAFHDNSINDVDGWRLDNVAVYEVADATAPDRVRQLTVTPDAGGALGATLTFTLPRTDISGNSVGTITRAVVYALDGTEIASTDNVAAGAEVSVRVSAVHGWNDYKVVAANGSGEGWPVIVRSFIGADVPLTVQDLKVKWGDDRTKAVLSWELPEGGVNGGYVDSSQLKYTIYKYDPNNVNAPYTALGEVNGENSVEVTILDATETQDQYIFAVTAMNAEGESDYARTSIVLGVPYTLPVAEPFSADGIDYSPWILVAGKNGQTWTLDGGHYNDKIQPQNDDGLQILFLNTGTEDASGSFTSPIIDFTDTEMPVLKVWLHHSDAIPSEAYVTVGASLDGTTDYVAAGDTVRLTGNNGWTEHVFNLSSLKGKKAQIALTAYVPDGATRIFADNYAITEATGNDLALAAVSQPYMPVVGDTADITVTVTNVGAQTADGYTVLFNINGETVSEASADKPLEAGRQATFDFTLPISSGMDEYTYSAIVMYDDDDDMSNNTSAEVTLQPRQIDLPVPTGLMLEGSSDLVWNEPEAMDGRDVILDFEDVPAFMLDNINGWTTYDGDGHLTTSFVQYYNNYWPYCNQPFAWMTWSSREAGCPDAAMWTAYEGEKCLIHFGNYGIDADGRVNTERDDDWFISPEVKAGTELSMMTLSNDATSELEILVSSTDREPESFNVRVTKVTYDATATWKEVTVTLPDDAKYVAIHTIADNFGIMIDNIRYTEAQAPVLEGYNVYCDGEGISLVFRPEAAVSQNGTYAVSAVYDLGESELSNTVSVTTGIDVAGVTDGIRITGGDGCITVTGAEGDALAVYTAGGVRKAVMTAARTETIYVPEGVYIVKAGSVTGKVIVK